MKSVYVGMDVAARECAICVTDRRGVIREQVMVRTSEKNLVDYLTSIDAKVMLHLEECDMAGWLALVLTPHVEELVVSDPHYNHLIHRFGSKADAEDARKLASLLRLNGYRPIYHALDPHILEFRALVKLQLSLARRIAGQKNRVKAVLRREGVVVEGTRLWAKRRRSETLSLLPAGLTPVLASELCVLDALREQEAACRRLIAREAKNFGVIAALDEVPGIGLLLAARFFAFILTPHRFPGRRQLWRYCRLGVRTCESGGKKLKGDRLDKAGNGVLKDLSRKAFTAAVYRCKEDNMFNRHYRAGLSRGLSEDHARLDTQRLILAVMWAMWRDGTRYCERDIKEAA